MGSIHINERRRHPRVKMELPLEYRVPDASQAHGALVINASESGILFQSIKDIPVGTRLNIAVLFPRGFELANFEVFAEIVWKDISWGENREGYQFGLKFIDLSKGEHQKLSQALAGDNGTKI